MMIRRHLIALMILGTFLFMSGLLVGIWIQDALDVDACLDHGGSWDYHRQTCVYQ